MNLDDTSTNLLFTTAPIWVDKGKGKTSSGTGFFYSIPLSGEPSRHAIFLVTNFHIVSGGQRAVFEMARYDEKLGQPNGSIKIEISQQFLTAFCNEKDDLAAIPIAPFLNQLEEQKVPVFFKSIEAEIIPSEEAWESFSAIEEITFIGYPSGLYDAENYSPIVRRGITATPIWNNFQGRTTFLIDAGVFPGSSGSPVFVFNQGPYALGKDIVVGKRLYFVGAITGAFSGKSDIQDKFFLGLGAVVKAIQIRKFLDEVATTLKLPRLMK